MVNLNPLLVSFALKAVATMLAGIVMGSSFYVLWVECPARLTQDMATAVKLWKEFFQRAKKSQVLCSSGSMICAIVTYVVDGTLGREDIGWLIAPAFLFATIIYTVLFIAPVNNQLLETEKCIEERGEKWIKATLEKWGRLHSIRVILGCAGFDLMVFLLCRQAYRAG